MSAPTPPALADYQPAFSRPDEPFLSYVSFGPDKEPRPIEMTRVELWSMARRAAGVLRAHQIGRGDCFGHYFTGNHWADLAFRLAGPMVGAVAVTINWQADTPERIAYKIDLTDSRLVIVDDGVAPEALADLARRCGRPAVFDVAELPAHDELPDCEFCRPAELDRSADKIVIFTSGTTGRPKGVRLPYGSYVTNRATFESFLAVAPADELHLVIVNPMHHTNSTAITDWALRRPGTKLHLIQRYTTPYWSVLAGVAEAAGPDARIVAPLVSRHIDFLDGLRNERRLPVDPDRLAAALGRVDVLLGSAPVGPTTVARLRDLTGRAPLVRFGSTETCLQVMGTPVGPPEPSRLKAFEAGWRHSVAGEATVGYYIGRPHPPHTECRVVRAITRGDDGYFVDCPEGRPGYLITRGGNLMAGYVGDDDATAEVMHDGGWYTGLRDVCFWLTGDDGRRDYYWMSRDSALLIRGGANYSYSQINAELKDFISTAYELPADGFDVAVVGLRTRSEHEDDCHVTIDLTSPEARDRQAALEGTFISDARRAVSKPARPDFVRFARIPRNFKGAILVGQLKEDCDPPA